MTARQQLYNSIAISPIFDPMDSVKDAPRPLVIDLSMDVSNHTRIYHDKTDGVRALLAGADTIVCDNEVLAGYIKKFAKGVMVFSAPYGYCSKGSVETEGFTVGILNLSDEQQINNMHARQMLKKIKARKILIGDSIDGISVDEEATDLDDFASRTDVLVLPSTRGSINAISDVLHVMSAGTAVLAAHQGAYYSLNPATGLKLIGMNATPRQWHDAIAELDKDPKRLQTLKDFNAKYARRVSQESLQKISKLAQRLSIKVAA